MELANPVWHALRGPQATVAEGGPLAFRYQQDVALFAAIPDEPSPDAWAQLRELVGPGEFALLFRYEVEQPADWETLFAVPSVQMVATALRGELDDQAEQLTDDDVPDMLAIVERTNPGPFSPRTIALGEYFGIRDENGALIAMAGERMFAPPYREISAVCTDEAHRGRGLAARLVRHLAARITARGETPILHAISENVNAIRLYEALGFTLTREFAVTGYRAPA
jgi:ribosomal protein S18 acetylase RimI-like enzyme